MIEVCRIEDVPVGEGRALTVMGRRIAIFNAPSGWHALDDACPHRGGPLADGLLADSCVTCPLHERRFDLSSGRSLGGEEGVVAHAVHLHGDCVYVELAREGGLPRAA